MPAIPLPMQSNPQEFREQGDERLINCYAELIGEEKYRLRRAAGYTLLSEDNGVSNCRGAIEADGFIYAVWDGGAVQKIAQDGTRTTIGHIGGSGYVDMARNAATPFQIGVVSPSNGRYYVIEEDAVSIVDTRDLPQFNSIAWVGGYFALGCHDGRFFVTGLNDARSINGIDFATAEGAPDGLARVWANRLQLVLFGQRTIEFWGLDSSPEAQGVPFSRLDGAVIPKGCDAPFSVVEIDNTFFWIYEGKVFRNNNYSPMVISHYGVERAIEGEADKANIRGKAYALGGNEFYEISGTDWTWVFNARTQKWHELRSYLRTRINADTVVKAWGDYYAFTKVNGALFRIDLEANDEAGSPMVVAIRFADIPAKRALMRSFEADLVTGRAPITGASNLVEPVVELTWSDDGGGTWANCRQFSLGRQGNYDKRVRSLRLGQTGQKYGRRFELRISDPAVVALTQVLLNEDA